MYFHSQSDMKNDMREVISVRDMNKVMVRSMVVKVNDLLIR